MEPDSANIGKCIHQIFQERVGQMPRTICVEDEYRRLSYSELDSRSNHLASYLCALGVAPEVPVGILLGPSVDVAVAVIGVLKAGGAYTALDSRYRNEQLIEIMRDAGLSFVVTTVTLATRLPGNIIPIYLDRFNNTLETSGLLHGTNPIVTLDNAALIRYTSGSSGRPKGVINTHRSLVNRLESNSLFDVQPSDVCAVDTNFGFGTRLLYPLVRGAQAVIIPGDYTKDTYRLVKFLGEKGVTSIFLIPTLLREILRLDSQAISKLNKLRVITTGGETLTMDIVERFSKALPDTLLVNTYGSNEIGGTATMKTTLTCADASFAQGSVGVPVTNTRVYILDEEGNPVASSERGEICVGSAHLARGYLNRPDLTAERFVPDPFSSSKGARMFRTGDLGRKNSIGEIEFLGRSDRQVKIRGFRVELEGIEAVLQKHPLVHQAVAVARSNDEITQIIAYVESNGASLTSLELREYMRQVVPDHMVPAIFVFVDQIPINFRGKVDQASLPDPMHYTPSKPIEAHKLTRTEGILYDLWRRTLGAGPLNVRDDFFELGGDSVTAMKITAGIRKTLELELPVSAVFQYPTISQLAQHILSITQGGP